jgi:hypothetical protein
MEGGVVERAHSLEGNDAGGLGGTEDLERLCLGGAEGLFDDDVLATGDAGERLFVVKCVGTANIDGVDVSSSAVKLRSPPCLVVKAAPRSASRESVPTNAAWSLALTTWIKSSVIMDVPMVAIRSMYPPRAVRFTG